jgi:dTDP-4-dehydrorhamnose reductase
MILLTGVGGQVGSHLEKKLARFGAVRAVDHDTLDLKDESAIRAFVRDLKPQIIVNPAAYTAVDKAESEAETAHLVNAVAPRVLAEEAKALGALLIHFSTDYVLPGHGTEPQGETAPTGPLNVYGKTKLAGEQGILASGAAATILRTSWVFSSHGANFVKTMLRLGAEKEELRVVADQVGAPTSASCLADATVKVIGTSLAQGREAATGLYHVACRGETSWHGFAVEIHRLAREAGLPVKTKVIHPIATEDYPTPAVRLKNSRFDLTKFSKTFRHELPTWQAELAQVIKELAGTSRPA